MHPRRSANKTASKAPADSAMAGSECVNARRGPRSTAARPPISAERTTSRFHKSPALDPGQADVNARPGPASTWPSPHSEVHPRLTTRPSPRRRGSPRAPHAAVPAREPPLAVEPILRHLYSRDGGCGSPRPADRPQDGERSLGMNETRYPIALTTAASGCATATRHAKPDLRPLQGHHETPFPMRDCKI